MKNNLLKTYLCPLTLEEQVLTYWNDTFTGVKGTRKHRSLNVSIQLQNEITGELYFTTLHQIIANTLLSYKIEYIKESILNYSKILASPDHYYTFHQPLATFLNDKLFVKFFNSAKPFETFRKKYKNTIDDPLKTIAQSFAPKTVSYDKENIYDRDKRTYYGFPIAKLKKYHGYEEDVLFELKTVGYEKLNPYAIELVIAALLLFRKKDPQLGKLTKFMKLWKENK